MADSPPSKSSPLHILFWVAFGLFILVFILPSCLVRWLPASVERHEQRQKVAERVQAAGGWDAIRRDCISLAEQHTNGYYSHWPDTNLPPAIVALKPLIVEYHPDDGRVSMRIFGMHSTGGCSTPYFGLEVVTKKNGDFKPGEGYGVGAIGNRHSMAEPVAEGIYEIY